MIPIMDLCCNRFQKGIMRDRLQWCLKGVVLLGLLFPLPLKALDPATQLAASVHKGFDCTTCHNDEKLPNKKNVPEICGQCHTQVLNEYQQSIHGIAVAKGNPDAPSCTDCHGIHSILPAIEKLSRVYPTNIAKTTCPECHASERIITKYNLPVGRVETFKDTYHGMATQLGDVHVANCASCHGIHNILPSSDPRSQVHPDHLTQTCGQCHPNANQNFIKGNVHGYVRNDVPGRVIRFITRFYLLLIVMVVGGYLLHDGLDYLKKVRDQYQERKKAPSFLRMNRNERLQHGFLMISFITLVITGFALKFGWYLPYVPNSVNVFLRSTLHRICGIVLLVVIFYHMIYVLTNRRGRTMFREMLPRWNDVRQFRGYLSYLLVRGEKPRFGFFTYWEKMEYWSVIWGSLLMGVTGFILWFENASLQILPKWGIDVATLIHYLEAILATLAILVGHLYFVIVNPDVQPMSFTWLTGKIPAKQARKEHSEAYPHD